jgi:hypothetical protein
MKTYGEVAAHIHVLLTSVLVGVKFHASVDFPREGATSNPWIGSWVGPRAGLDNVKRRKILPLPAVELRPLGLPVRSQSLY